MQVLQLYASTGFEFSTVKCLCLSQSVCQYSRLNLLADQPRVVVGPTTHEDHQLHM